MFTTTELFGKFHSPRRKTAAGAHSRQRIYTYKTTFLAFLNQALNPGSSCRDAVRHGQAYYQNQPVPRCLSPDNSPYCQARANLPLDRLSAWDHPVKVDDGTCVTAPDTEENQAAYPQSTSQKPGCGFPQIRLLALFSLDTGALLERPYGPTTTSELRLFIQLWPALFPGDLLLGDRLYGCYALLAELQRLGVAGAFRLNSQRDHDFRRGKRLGHHDRLMTWYKPKKQPAALTDEQWARVPDHIVVREVKITLTDPSLRVKARVLVTTLLDRKAGPKERLAALVRRRWQVELNLDDLKTTLQMDRLQGQTPAMLHRELEMHLIAYNLIRAVMLEASLTRAVPLYRLSFKGTLATRRAFDVSLVRVPPTQPKKRQAIYEEMLSTIAKDLVPERPGRREPRCQKQRPKNFPFLTKPRRQMQDDPKSSRRKKKRCRKS